MARTADYVIQGFHYQLHKTLLEIVIAEPETIITVEGMIEDIEIEAHGHVRAVQCKYHETKIVYTPSSIYKPLLQMMSHFQRHPGASIKYVLFVHFSGIASGAITVDSATLQSALSSKNADFQEIIKELSGKVNLNTFLARFSVELGPSYDELVASSIAALVSQGIDPVEVETLIYPNAIHIIGALSIKHNVVERLISKAKLLEMLRKIKTTAISQWTLSLQSRKKLLAIRRKQFKESFSTNTRRRCIAIDKNSLPDFDASVAIFIRDYIAKYHFKVCHVNTPTFLLNTSQDDIDEIERRLYDLGITFNNGFIGGKFQKEVFFRKSIVNYKNSEIIAREFDIRLLRWEVFQEISMEYRVDDLLAIGTLLPEYIGPKDVKVDKLAAASFDEIKYMIGVSNVCE